MRAKGHNLSMFHPFDILPPGCFTRSLGDSPRRCFAPPINSATHWLFHPINGHSASCRFYGLSICIASSIDFVVFTGSFVPHPLTITYLLNFAALRLLFIAVQSQ